MAFIDKILFRDAQTVAHLEQIRAFHRRTPKRGLLEEFGLTNHNDARYGRFDRKSDGWEDGHATLLSSNPHLRRLDFVADSLFLDGEYRVLKAGRVFPRTEPFVCEGTLAVIHAINSRRNLEGVLTIDLGDMLRFGKLRLLDRETDHAYTVRPSSLDRGIVVEACDALLEKDLPVAVNERAREPLGVFKTITETIEALKRMLRFA